MSESDFTKYGIAAGTTAATAGGLGAALNSHWTPVGLGSGLGFVGGAVPLAGTVGANIHKFNQQGPTAFYRENDGMDAGSVARMFGVTPVAINAATTPVQRANAPISGNSMDPEITAMERAGATPEQIAEALTPASVKEEAAREAAEAAVNTPAPYYPTYDANRKSGFTSVAEAYKNNPAMLKMPKQAKKAGTASASIKAVAKAPAKQEVKVNSLDWLNDLLPLLAAGGLGYLVARH
jgi:hypothetical protein